MKTLNEKRMVLALLLAAACAPTSPPPEETPRSAEEAGQGAGGGPSDQGCPADDDGLVVEVRIKGENRGSFDAVLLQVRELEARANGQALRVTPGVAVVDLANEQQAWRIGTFLVPSGASAVELSLRLDDFGGYERARGADWFDSRLPPIRVTAPVSLLALRGHVVVHVDLQRSVLHRDGRSTLLLPSIAFHY